jgi:predicted AlkP superfamily phosphohydrolase/phosphomutase
MVYFRSVDVASHRYWRHFRPQGFARPPSPQHADEVPRAYRAVDGAIGALVAAAPHANFLVVSDHGFESLAAESVVVTMDFERVLERLGFLAGERGKLDFARTEVYSYTTPPTSKRRRLRFAVAGETPGGKVLPRDVPAVRRRLEEALTRVTWEDGTQAFRLREPNRRERKAGAQLIAEHDPAAATATLLVDGEPLPAAIKSVAYVSGTHDAETHGLLIAAGPDVAAGADLGQVSIVDVAPTVLYALGLPVGRDFTGRPVVELFTPDHRSVHPLRTVETWGKPRQGRAAASSADRELVDELRGLGYLK